MKLSLAANYDSALIPELKAYPVEEVYGKLPADFAGGGRPSYMGDGLSPRDLARYVALLAENGIAFNYLLNAACMGNREWGRSFQKKLMALLERLGQMGVKRLTVSTPFLLEAIKARFPEFYVKVGIYAQVDTPRRARFWEDLGADAITLESFSINRDFRRLAAIREAVGCELQLIANHPCLPNCPLQVYHQNGFAHGSDGSRRLFIDYCFLRCTRLRLADPSLLIKAAWIRPEDIAAYEALGFGTFKLLERNIPSGELLKRVKAYSRRSFQGNLAEILLPYGFKETPRRGVWWAARHFLRPLQLNPFRIRELHHLVRRQGMLFPLGQSPIRIDAARIPADFIAGFRDRDCAARDCSRCRYCEEIAQRAVVVDEDFRRRALAQFARIETAMVNGSLWGVESARS
jgi:collagenase-like PrtC family protease